MKIGILTYHRAENYGALLQAYGLKTYLETLGHDVSFVDYWPDYHKEYFDLFSIHRFMNVGLKAKAIMLYNLLFYNIRKKRKQNLQRFMYGKLGLSKASKYTSHADLCNEYDVVFYGSDQIWRKQGMPSHPGFDLWYIGSENITAKKKIAYAASMGPTILSMSDKEFLKQMLKNFSFIYARESSLKVLVNELGYHCNQVIDPVFLLDKNKWGGLTSNVPLKKQKYILVYNLLANKDTIKFAEMLGKKHGLTIVEISKSYGFRKLTKRYNHTASVEEFLSLIKNSEFVVSNSFHGVAFSIIFEKQFYAVGMGNKADRVKSLLNCLKLNDRYVTDFRYSENAIDYSISRILLSEEISRSKGFINKSFEAL